MASLGYIVAVAVGVLVAADACWHKYPYHASCEVTWNVGMSCAQANASIVNQMLTWQDRHGCPNSGSNNTGKTLGEKCLYQLVSTSAAPGGGFVINGHHYTPVENYSDTFNFKLTQKPGDASSCVVAGSSSSDIWYAYLDLGTNYCNVFNLVDGAGLTNTNGYSEKTDDCVCTQYTSRNCTIY